MRICHPLLDLLDRFIKLHFGISCSDVSYAFRVYKDNVLAVLCQQPNYKIGMEVTCFEESHATSFAEIA